MYEYQTVAVDPVDELGIETALLMDEPVMLDVIDNWGVALAHRNVPTLAGQKVDAGFRGGLPGVTGHPCSVSQVALQAS